MTRDADLLARARRVLPGIAQTYSKGPDQHVLGAYPVYLERGDGCRVWDVDGNSYIDYPCALGPVVLGYNDAGVDAAIAEALGRGMTFSLASPLEVEVAEQVVEMVPCADAVRFLKTGSEATSAAVRLARAFTGRDHVAMCGYHGWHDWAVGHTARAAGVPRAVAELTHQWTYNDIDSLRALFERLPGAVAAVIMEPVGIEPPAPGFLEAVRDLAHERGALLIFDEVITGFRFAPGGAQELFGVVPDVAAFGKAVANGMPLAVVAGRGEVMDHVATDTFISSTFGGETLSLAAAHATLTRIRQGGVVEHLWSAGEQVRDGFNEMASQHGVPARMVGYPPRRVLQIDAPEGVEANVIKGLIWQECLDRGVLLSNANFVSLAHDAAAVGETVAAFDGALQAVAGHLAADPRAALRGDPPGEVFRRP